MLGLYQFWSSRVDAIFGLCIQIWTMKSAAECTSLLGHQVELTHPCCCVSLSAHLLGIPTDLYDAYPVLKDFRNSVAAVPEVVAFYRCVVPAVTATAAIIISLHCKICCLLFLLHGPNEPGHRWLMKPTTHGQPARA
jgi:hypothetical protein